MALIILIAISVSVYVLTYTLMKGNELPHYLAVGIPLIVGHFLGGIANIIAWWQINK